MPERYEVNQEIKLKNLILKEFKPDEKKKIKEYVKSVTLKYVINDEEIQSVEDDRYIFKVIQYFDFEIRKSRFLLALKARFSCLAFEFYILIFLFSSLIC